jgi:hypothetical protein
MLMDVFSSMLFLFLMFLSAFVAAVTAGWLTSKAFDFLFKKEVNDD